jgi:hypothetical protein
MLATLADATAVVADGEAAANVPGGTVVVPEAKVVVPNMFDAVIFVVLVGCRRPAGFLLSEPSGDSGELPSA